MTDGSEQTGAKRFKTGLVAILDGLGVRDRDEASTIDFIRQRDEFMSEVREELGEAGAGGALARSVATFGDTFITTFEVSNGPMTREAIKPFVRALTWGFRRALKHGLPLRGAVAFGRYLQEGTTILGPAVSDAAAWYGIAEWLGVLATPRTTLWLRSQPPDSLLFVERDVALKGGLTRNLACIPWPLAYINEARSDEDSVSGKYDSNSLAAARKSMLQDLSNLSIPLGAELKYFNTVAFYESIAVEFDADNQTSSEPSTD